MAATDPVRTGRARGDRSWQDRAVVALTVAGMLLALWLFTASGLVAPPWAVVALLVGWLALAVLAVRLCRRRTAWALLVPLVALALWAAVLTVGEALLGWTA